MKLCEFGLKDIEFKISSVEYPGFLLMPHWNELEEKIKQMPFFLDATAT